MSTTTATGAQLLSDDDFFRISDYIEMHYGIQLPISKKKMVEARLQKRLRALRIDSFPEYFEFAFSQGQGEEYNRMVDLITTNKTEFFREPAHFDYLTQVVLPEFGHHLGNAPGGLKVWSAASSTGEEIYSILITIEEFLFRQFKKFPYQILGTDLSGEVLQQAVKAVYDEDRIDAIPMAIKKKYFQRSKDRENPRARVKADFLKNVAFRQVNLLKSLHGIERHFDVIFCRNVLIYFNRDVQFQVVQSLCEHLKIGGYLFIGHSESLTNMNLPLKQVKPTIYKKIR
ncbi:CheR family methyltransferase [Pseudochryseolinea flava]|uniref:protein-glutamate O-methyltransferase n=1 Tax=Pseudochryseolinea flava TaxID=2059302 RepID=A0A364Y1F1_9BACT|nr:protein-glutamate O-methyltransferase CheR [Pseudochryseolinea flava]RAW00534.1 chemotaxis protein CheR [Pseudochryseolinea flava]